jgi:hypothetical protein
MKKTVRRCGAVVRWQVRCPRSWDALTPTDEADVRHCSQCNEQVHFCRDDRETIEHARAGHCIAREEPSANELPALVLGRATEVVSWTAAEEEALARMVRERGIEEALRSGDWGVSARVCPQCGYAVPGFRPTCYVCRHELGRT